MLWRQCAVLALPGSVLWDLVLEAAVCAYWTTMSDGRQANTAHGRASLPNSNMNFTREMSTFATFNLHRSMVIIANITCGRGALRP
eukprot:5860109-Pleurochrysis_carterae.AAC.1